MIPGLLALGITAAIPGAALAGEEKPEADFTLGAYSQYVWRGFAFSDNSLVLQPSLTVAYKGFGVNLWGNLDTDEKGLDTSNWNETDMTVSYDGSAGMVGYGVGWILYSVDGAEDTQELYASVSVDTILAPTLTYYA
ncbi:MAG: TorF family putative porin, partial [Desulfurivibrionaceae bacterium]